MPSTLSVNGLFLLALPCLSNAGPCDNVISMNITKERLGGRLLEFIFKNESNIVFGLLLLLSVPIRVAMHKYISGDMAGCAC